MLENKQGENVDKYDAFPFLHTSIVHDPYPNTDMPRIVLAMNCSNEKNT